MKIFLYHFITLMMKPQYILFVMQEANFQSRSMLVPKDNFLKVRGQDYEILKKNASDRTFTIKGSEYLTSNVVIQKWIPNRLSPEILSFTTEDTPCSHIINELTRYADDGDMYELENMCFIPEDEEWLDESVFGVCKGFNHVMNYLNLLERAKSKGVEIFDSFLVLEQRGNNLNVEPMYDTVEEMLEEMYGVRTNE